MQCRRCGKELGASPRCSFCGYQNAEDGKVREMSSVERINYNGITIEAPEHEFRQGHQQQHDSSARSNFSRGAYGTANIWSQLFGTHIVTRIIVAIALVMLIAFTIFVALPITLTVVGCLVLYVLINRVLRRRWR